MSTRIIRTHVPLDLARRLRPIPHGLPHAALRPGDELVLHLLSDRMMLAEVCAPSPFAEVAARLREEAREKGITRAQVERAVSEAREEVHRERQPEDYRGLGCSWMPTSS